MRARPIGKIGHGLYIIWPTFAECPHSHNFNARKRRLPERLRHSFTIFIAIHHRDICTYEAKWFAVDFKTAAMSLYEVTLRRGASGVWTSAIKENRRAHNQCECGDHDKCFIHQGKKQKRSRNSGYRGLVNLTKPIMAQNAPSTTNRLK